MSAFKWGETVIDTNKRLAVDVVSTADSSHGTLYIVWNGDADEYYITSEYDLIPYDKYWFENNVIE